MAATVPAASYPSRAGSLGFSRYCPLRNIDSARFSPSALMLIWTSPFPGRGHCNLFNLKDFWAAGLVESHDTRHVFLRLGLFAKGRNWLIVGSG